MRYIFDLKGSLVDRYVKGKTKPSTTLKDLNFIKTAEAHPGFVNFGEAKRKQLLAVVKKDVEFLSSRGFMDYSLLLAVENYSKSDNEKDLLSSQELGPDVGELMARRHCFIYGNRAYHLAVIDFLQDWNFSKKAERFMKTTLLGKDPDNLSAIEPIRYS